METVLITGASSGIGLEFAKIFAENNYNLVLVARSKEKLEELAATLKTEHGVQTIVIPKDLSDPVACTELFNEIQNLNIHIDILVNNAGFTVHGNFYESDLEKTRQLINVNISALTILTRLFLPQMIEWNKGRILNVASTAAFMPGPLMSVYYASKAYVLSFSEGLSGELKGTGVTITALCPGATKTNFAHFASMENSLLFSNPGVMDAHRVAREGYKALIKGKQVIIPGISNKIMAIGTRFVPRNFAAYLAKNVQKI